MIAKLELDLDGRTVIADNKTSPLAYVRNVQVQVMLHHADQGFITAGRRCRVARSKRNGLAKVPAGGQSFPPKIMKSWQTYIHVYIYI